MDLKFIVNDYVLIWNLLFQASISEPIYKLKQKLWDNYKIEYNNTYKDKNQILKDIKNFIPNDDTIYNIVLENKEYDKLVKKAEKYRLEVMKNWDSNKKKNKELLKKIIKKDIKPYSILIVNEELNIIDSSGPKNDELGVITLGKKIDKKEPLKIVLDIILEIIKKEIPEKKTKNDIRDAIIELAVLNELPTNLEGKSCYLSGNPSLSYLKRQLYPYWLMYLGVPKDEFLSYMMRDKIAFEKDSIAYEKELKKMDLEEFIDFCHRNRKYIVKPEPIEII